MTKNNVKVNVRFTCEKDENLDLFNLKANVSYCLPEEIGFKKQKSFDLVVIEDKTFIEWIKEAKSLMVGTRIKNVIYKEVSQHIMERLRNAYDKNPDVVSNILNMFNQMKFEFHFDVAEAEKVVMSEAQAFGKKPNDYFNLHE